MQNLQKIANTISLIGKKLEKSDDEYDAIGKNVAAKLNDVTATQQGRAEKLINEILLLGRFEWLNFNTTTYNPSPVQVPQTPLLHIPAIPVQTQETQASQILLQDSQTISIPDTLIKLYNFENYSRDPTLN